MLLHEGDSIINIFNACTISPLVYIKNRAIQVNILVLLIS